MSHSGRQKAIIVGAGPLVSRSLSLWLASENWEIVLISRSQHKLTGYAKEIVSTYPDTKVHTHTGDASKPSSLITALDWAASQLGGRIDVLCYNAADLSEFGLMSVTPEELEFSFKVSAIGTLVAGQWLSKHTNEHRSSIKDFAVFLVPGGVLDKNPIPNYASLSAAKSASQNLTRQFSITLPEEYSILVGMPVIVERILPLEGGGWATRSVPSVIVDKIFRPYFEDRDMIRNGKMAAEDWTFERAW